MRPIVKGIFERHTSALQGVTGQGTWIDLAAARLSLWLALDELDAHHMGINPATNGSIARWRKLEEDLFTFLDDVGADGKYEGDPVYAVRELFQNRNDSIVKLAECVDEQARIIEDLRQQLRQAQAAQLPPTVHVNGSSPKTTTPEDVDRQMAAASNVISALTAYLAPPAATYVVTAIDEVDYPPTATETPAPAAAALPPTRVNWLGLPRELQAQILKLDAGDVTWRSLANTDRRAIALYAIPRVGSAAMTMAEWLECKPAWMPTASGLAQMFGLRWSELVAQAHRVMAE